MFLTETHGSYEILLMTSIPVIASIPLTTKKDPVDHPDHNDDMVIQNARARPHTLGLSIIPRDYDFNRKLRTVLYARLIYSTVLPQWSNDLTKRPRTRSEMTSLNGRERVPICLLGVRSDWSR